MPRYHVWIDTRLPPIFVGTRLQLPTVSVWLVECNMTLYIVTNQMIYHRGGEPERTMHCCHGTQAMDNNRICHRLLTFHERGKQYFMQPFLQSMKLLRLSLNFILKLWAEFLALMNVDYAWTYLKANSTTVRDLYCLWAACLPLSVIVRSCHACINLSRFRSSGFLHTDAALWQ